jgi:hypothetical protein
MNITKETGAVIGVSVMLLAGMACLGAVIAFLCYIPEFFK